MAFPPKKNNSSRPYFRGPQQKEDEHRINHKIRDVAEVRLVGEGIEPGVYPFAKAVEMAKQMDLDLVEISPNAQPPVCRIIDYSKFKYEQKKKQKELKAKTQKVVVKEIRFGPQTDEHDFNFKLKHAETFLKEGSKVKAYVQFHGRQIVFKNQGVEMLTRFIAQLAEFGKPEAELKLEGKRMMIILTPKPKK